MKGLLYKDISIMTRSFKGNILLLVALYGVLILVTREAYLAYAMTVVWGIYVASTINYDEQAHWDAYAATLPVTPGRSSAASICCARPARPSVRCFRWHWCFWQVLAGPSTPSAPWPAPRSRC